MEQKPKVQTHAPAPVKRHKRYARNILIHKPMQREFTLVLIALLMVSTFAIGFVIHNTIREMAFGGGGYQFGKINPYEMLSDISYQLVLRVSFILFATLIVVALFGVFFLHRVAGPVYRFRQIFLRLNDGEMPHPVKLREGDFFIETAVEINRLMSTIQYEKEKAKQLKNKLEQILSSSADESIKQSARELKTILESEIPDQG